MLKDIFKGVGYFVFWFLLPVVVLVLYSIYYLEGLTQ